MVSLVQQQIEHVADLRWQRTPQIDFLKHRESKARRAGLHDRFVGAQGNEDDFDFMEVLDDHDYRMGMRNYLLAEHVHF